MRLGLAEESIDVELQIARNRPGDLAQRYLPSFGSMRLAWGGRFQEAREMLSSSWRQLPFDFDRLYCGSQLALFLAMDGERQSSIDVLTEINPLFDLPRAEGLFLTRTVELARVLGALTEAVNGRSIRAYRILRRVTQGADGVILLAAGVVDVLVRRLGTKDSSRRSDIAGPAAEALTMAGYGTFQDSLLPSKERLSREKVALQSRAS